MKAFAPLLPLALVPLVVLPLLFSCTSAGKGLSQSPAKAEAEMTERELAGQMIICGFNGTELTPEFHAFLHDYAIGNVILFARNIRSVEQTRKLCRDIQQTVQERTGSSAFICVDQEGGRISRIPRELTPLCAAADFAARHKPADAYKAGLLTARQLALCGINVNFAPVADINSNPRNPVIGDRAYGITPQQVSPYVSQMAKGLQAGGIVCAAKHFPGHGDTDEDSHVALPLVRKSLPELRSFELKPFRQLAAEGIPMIMTAHIMFPLIDADRPATLSHTFLTDILRKELHFKGIIVTDDLEMQAIRSRFGVADGAVCAVQAGADMLCLSISGSDAAAVSDALTSRISRERLVESVRRIRAAKAGLPSIEALSAEELREKIEACNQLAQSKEIR